MTTAPSSIHAADKSAERSPCNVVPFPARAVTAQVKAIRRRRKAKGSNVLKFTGLTRYNYDRETLLAKHKECMQKKVIDLFGQLVNGEVTGLALSVTKGGPLSGVETTFHGLLAEEYNLTRKIAKGVFEYSYERLLEKGMHVWANEE
ncbi:hypothetical protein [Variovorax sp. YR752]|uniref:hypothetical protein n=1 Tax=Variovorax sp. YR752 TaxID=1884383 RepID=UPI0031377C03